MYGRIALQLSDSQVTSTQKNVSPQSQEPAPRSPAPPTPQGGSQGATQPQGKRGLGFRLGIPIAVIIIAVLLYYALSATSHTATKTNANNPLYELLIKKPMNLSAIAVLMFNKINSSQTLSVSYAGSAKVSSSSMGNITLNVPFTLSIMRYYDNMRIELSATSIPIIGSLSYIAVWLGNETFYTCAAASGLSSSSSGANYTCRAAHTNFTISSLMAYVDKNITLYTTPEGLAKFLENKSSSINMLGSMNINTNASFMGVNSFEGQSCYLIEESVSMYSSTLGASSAGTSCLSPETYLPLNVTYLTVINQLNSTSGSSKSPITITLLMHQTGSSNNVTQQEVTTLPGPVTNSTTFTTGQSVTIPINVTSNSTGQSVTIPINVTGNSTSVG